MFEKFLHKIRELIRTNNYVMTIHAEEEMDADNFSIFDIERCVLNGKIIERQRDKTTQELKYRISGQSVNKKNIEIIAKISVTEKLVIITVYEV